MKQLVETTRIGAGPDLCGWLHAWPAIYTCRIHTDRTHILLQFPRHPLVSNQPSRPGWPGVHDLSRCNGVSRSNLRAADGTGAVGSCRNLSCGPCRKSAPWDWESVLPTTMMPA